MDRSAQIIRTSVIGIVANVLLAAFKAVVGIIVEGEIAPADAGICHSFHSTQNICCCKDINYF